MQISGRGTEQPAPPAMEMGAVAKPEQNVSEALPDEIRDDILGRLAPREVGRMACVNRAWHHKVNEPLFTASYVQAAADLTCLPRPVVSTGTGRRSDHDRRVLARRQHVAPLDLRPGERTAALALDGARGIGGWRPPSSWVSLSGGAAGGSGSGSQLQMYPDGASLLHVYARQDIFPHAYFRAEAVVPAHAFRRKRLSGGADVCSHGLRAVWFAGRPAALFLGDEALLVVDCPHGGGLHLGIAGSDDAGRATWELLPVVTQLPARVSWGGRERAWVGRGADGKRHLVASVLPPR